MHNDNGLAPALCAQRLERFHQRVNVREWGITILTILLVSIALFFLSGCGQQTSTPVAQLTDQTAATPVATDQNAASQGSQVNVWLLNTTADGGLPNPDAIKVEAADYASMASEGQSTGTGNSSKDAKGGYVISGVTINVTTGDTTPSLTGTATGTGSASQSPAQNVAAYPVQDIKPEITASMPISVPVNGSIADTQSLATGRGQTSDTSKTSDNELRWQRIEAAANQLEKLAPLLDKFFGAQSPQIPTTQPAKTEPQELTPAIGG